MLMSFALTADAKRQVRKAADRAPTPVLDGQHQMKPAGDGWTVLQGSVAGGMMNKNGNLWWPTKAAAREDADIFKSLLDYHQKVHRSLVKKGDVPGAAKEKEALDYCYRAGIEAGRFDPAVKPEYHVQDEFEAQMSRGEHAGRAFVA